ncbi:TPA_asm: hypothetical protein G4P39_005190 [Salmonella enterica subsp. enterica serovar Muenchen]|nr:hypothetical protein [Salmonella enterica]HAE7669443.1 hypothetical protein [Salmonella enterica subsp. enterica serovar Muenchen]
MAFSEVAFVNGLGLDMRGECAVKFRYEKAPRMRGFGLILFKCAFLTDFVLSVRWRHPHFLVNYSIK